MESLPAVAGTAVVLFAGTNLDDFVVLAVQNTSSNAGGRPRRREIWVGQYTGVAILVVVSLLAARGLPIIPTDLTWMLGLLPVVYIAIGVFVMGKGGLFAL